jgi:hypothetical protein
VFKYLKHLWSSTITLIPDVELTKDDSEMSFTGDVQSFSHVWVRKRRYGAATQHRGKSAQYAYMDARVPMQIQHILRVKETLPDGKKLTASFAIVHRFQLSNMFNFPWDLW